MPIKQSLFAPNIMGTFAYQPFMECNHYIISLKHSLSGTLMFKNTEIILDNSKGWTIVNIMDRKKEI